MGTTFQGLSVAPRRDKLWPYVCATGALLEGAAVVYDTAKAAQQVKAPTGAAVAGFAGLIADVQKDGVGTVATTTVNLQRTGLGLGLLKSAQTVNVGDRLVIAGTDGSLRAFNDGVDTNCDIVGTSEQTKTAGATNEAILVNLDKFSTVP